MSANKVYKPTDYYRGTVMEPENISTLKASFGEYEALGNQHRKLSERIESLKEGMVKSRQQGAFQNLQRQMREVKNLVKEREDVDAQMAVLNLSRKKDDDHRLAVRQEESYSEQISSVAHKISQLEQKIMNFSEYDFARCQRPDGSFYGTRGKCRKGTESSAVTKEEKTSASKSPLARASASQLKGVNAKLGDLVRQLQQRAKEADKAFRKVDRETRKDKSPEAKKRRAIAAREADRAQRDAEKAQRALLKSQEQLAKTLEAERRRRMSPAQRAATARLDKEVRARG